MNGVSCFKKCIVLRKLIVPVPERPFGRILFQVLLSPINKGFFISHEHLFGVRRRRIFYDPLRVPDNSDFLHGRH